MSSGAALRSAFLVGVIVFLSSTAAAHAASITNHDEQDHKITIIEGDSKSEHLLKPAQVLTGVCEKGCIVRLNDVEDDEYQLEANDVVAIEDGSLYYEPDAPGAPAPSPATGAKGNKG